MRRSLFLTARQVLSGRAGQDVEGVLQNFNKGSNSGSAQARSQAIGGTSHLPCAEAPQTRCLHHSHGLSPPITPLGRRDGVGPVASHGLVSPVLIFWD